MRSMRTKNPRLDVCLPSGIIRITQIPPFLIMPPRTGYPNPRIRSLQSTTLVLTRHLRVLGLGQPLHLGRPWTRMELSRTQRLPATAVHRYHLPSVPQAVCLALALQASAVQCNTQTRMRKSVRHLQEERQTLLPCRATPDRARQCDKGHQAILTIPVIDDSRTS